MSDFKEIVDYLKILREPMLSKAQLAVIVNLDFDEKIEPHEDDYISVLKSKLANSFSYYDLNKEEPIDELYLQPQNNGKIFYFRKIEYQENNQILTQYQRVPKEIDSTWINLNEIDLVKLSISSFLGYFYDYVEAQIICTNLLDELILTNDTFTYHPEDLNSKNGVYHLNDRDLDNNKRFVLGQLVGLKDVTQRNFNDFQTTEREVFFTKTNQSGKVHLLPNIKGTTLTYNFVSKGTKFNDTWLTSPAIVLEFKKTEGLLEFLNHTIFFEFSSLNELNSRDRIIFLKIYKDYINALIDRNYDSYYKILKTLYYIPSYIMNTKDTSFLWDILDSIIKGGMLTESRNAAMESYTLHLLRGLYESYESTNIFLLELLKIIDNKTRLEHLNFRLDTENHLKLIRLLFQAWKRSSFTNPETYKNTLFKDTNGPIFLPYESEKWAGFYFSNANVSFETRTIKVQFETGRYEEVEREIPNPNPPFRTIKLIEKKEIIDNYIYHPYHPICIKNIEKQETTIAFESTIPAFLLYVNENKAWWNNFVKTGEYIIDGITIASGFASLRAAKYFAHVARLAEAAEGVTAASKVAKAANILSYVKGAAGVVEVTSGSVNLILKLTEQDETEFGQSLSKVLFYLELITLAGELTVPMKAGLKKSAREAIEKSNPRIRKSNRQLFDELYRITGIDELGLKILKVKNIDELGSQGNKIIFRLIDNDGNEIGDLIRTIAEKGRKLNFNLKINGKSYPISSSTELLNPQTAKVYDLPVNQGENIMYADLNIPTQITDEFSGLGNIMLDDTLAFYIKNPKFGKVDGNFGVWVTNPSYYDQYGGASVNLKQFWKAVDEQKMSYEEAAFETFTGKWAEKNGFEKVVIRDPKRDITLESVIIKFIK